jgi:hypothetical protein
MDAEKAEATDAEIEEAATAPVDYRALAVERATEDPATAALVLRAWLGTAEAEKSPPAPLQTALAS